MPIRIAWHDETHRVIRCTAEGKWTFDELRDALAQTIGMMDSAPHTVDFIIDVRGASMIPGGIGGAAQGASSVATPETHPREGVKVVLGANALVRMAYEAYRKLNARMGKQQEFLFARDDADARAILAQAQRARG